MLLRFFGFSRTKEDCNMGHSGLNSKLPRQRGDPKETWQAKAYGRYSPEWFLSTWIIMANYWQQSLKCCKRAFLFGEPGKKSKKKNGQWHVRNFWGWFYRIISPKLMSTYSGELLPKVLILNWPFPSPRCFRKNSMFLFLVGRIDQQQIHGNILIIAMVYLPATVTTRFLFIFLGSGIYIDLHLRLLLEGGATQIYP